MDRREQRKREEELLRQRRLAQAAALEAKLAQQAITGTVVGVPQIQPQQVSQVPVIVPAESDRVAFIRRSTQQSNAENVYDIMQNYAKNDQVYQRDQLYTRDEITRNAVWCADGSMNCQLPKDRFGLALTGDQIISFGTTDNSSRISQQGQDFVFNTPGVVRVNAPMNLNNNSLEIGSGQKISYSPASLDIYGGTNTTVANSRLVQVWDNLMVNGKLDIPYGHVRFRGAKTTPSNSGDLMTHFNHPNGNNYIRGNTWISGINNVSSDQVVGRNANVVGDLSFTGVNGWIIATPDDTRRQMIIAPRTADNKNWNWSKQMVLDNGGNLTLNGNLTATERLCLGKTCLTEQNVKDLLLLIKK